jgi:hypothetical protein
MTYADYCRTLQRQSETIAESQLREMSYADCEKAHEKKLSSQAM